MTSPDLLVALCALAGLTVVATTCLAGWQNWLVFKNRELDLRRQPQTPHSAAHHSAPQQPHPGDAARFAREGAARIEIADLKERVRRLEAIANGVDL